MRIVRTGPRWHAHRFRPVPGKPSYWYCPGCARYFSRGQS